MLKKLMFVAVFVVMLFAISAFAEDYVVLHPETMYQPSYVTNEWQIDSDLSDFPNPHATGRYNSPGRWYHGTQTGMGCNDQDFDGDLGVNNGRYSSQYPYSHHGYCGYIGTNSRTNPVGEGRTARAYDMRNDFFRMRRYDPAYFSPSADPTTDGWVAWRTAGGPAKHTYIPQTSDYAVDYWQRPAHWDLSNTSAADAMDLNATIDRVVMGFSVSKGSAITDDKFIEIAHSQPPIASSRVMTFDNIFGIHSNGTNYVDRVIFRTQLTDVAEQTYETHEFTYNNTATLANNYPTTRTATLGFILIDEPGTANDQFMYYGAGDTDPFINALIADMRSGRYMMWLVFRASGYYTDGWDQSNSGYYVFNSQRDSGNGDIIIAVGPAATAEDWVLYE